MIASLEGSRSTVIRFEVTPESEIKKTKNQIYLNAFKMIQTLQKKLGLEKSNNGMLAAIKEHEWDIKTQETQQNCFFLTFYLSRNKIFSISKKRKLIKHIDS